MAKKITRRQVDAWLAPMRACLRQMRGGYAESVQGYPVTRLHDGDDYVRVDYCLAGFAGLIERLFPAADLRPLHVLQRRLANGVLLDVSHIDDALAMLRGLEKPLMMMPVERVKSAVLTEQIAIEIESMKAA